VPPTRIGLPLLCVAAVALAACGAPPPEPGPTDAPAGVRTVLPTPVPDEGPACAAPKPGDPPPGTVGPQGPPIPVVLGKAGEPAPVDEIPFSHKAHAGDCKIPCLACHVYAEKSPVAGLPSGKKCMGCHKFVAKEKPAVQVLAARVKAGQPLRWTRVFAVPDFVYFTHRAHLHFKEKIECKECHGDVAAMKVVSQDTPFTMGRCLTCHESKKAPRDCLVCHK
jgi:hypothetical protein